MPIKALHLLQQSDSSLCTPWVSLGNGKRLTRPETTARLSPIGAGLRRVPGVVSKSPPLGPRLRLGTIRRCFAE